MSWIKCICPHCTAPYDHEVPGPETEFDELIERIQKLKSALKRIRDHGAARIADCTEIFQEIAREALE